jgi:hypothetical protein
MIKYLECIRGGPSRHRNLQWSIVVKYLSQDRLFAFEIGAGDRSYEKQIWITLDLVAGPNCRELNARERRMTNHEIIILNHMQF